jgi:BirA family biotin operon repressor/biotin-[acetyl-CoA-carboxylase] ligase
MPNRPALSAAALERALVVSGGLFSRIDVVDATGSTNADVTEAARTGAEQGYVLVAESQLAGRGRLGRSWQAPPRAGLTMSVLLRPKGVEARRLGWLPLLTGVALSQACAQVAPGVECALKWPNDLLVRPAGGSSWGKCAGILAEVAAADTIVVGIGINVSQVDGELPPTVDPHSYPPTSLLAAAAHHGAYQDDSRSSTVTASCSRSTCAPAAGDPQAPGLLNAYRALCLTLHRDVAVQLPADPASEPLVGIAKDIDVDGRLVVGTVTGERRIAAGDVHHVR